MTIGEIHPDTARHDALGWRHRALVAQGTEQGTSNAEVGGSNPPERASPKRAESMHRRAQQAEGRLKRVMYWIDAGLHQEPRDKNAAGHSYVSRFYLELAKREADSK